MPKFNLRYLNIMFIAFHIFCMCHGSFASFAYLHTGKLRINVFCQCIKIFLQKQKKAFFSTNVADQSYLMRHVKTQD